MGLVVKSMIPVIIISAISVLLIFNYFISWGPTDAFRQNAMTWSIIISNFALFLGAAVLIRYNGKNLLLSKNRNTQFNALTILISFMVFVLVGWGYGLTSSTYFNLYNSVIYPISSALWGLYFIWGGMAVYRSFRITSLETLSLFLAGTLTFIRDMPFIYYYLPFLTIVGEWVMKYPAGSSYTVGVIATSFGIVIVSIRTILGREKGSVT